MKRKKLTGRMIHDALWRIIQRNPSLRPLTTLKDSPDESWAVLLPIYKLQYNATARELARTLK